MKYTPDNIEELKEGYVFVFGSNLGGNHMGGAAKIAYEKFGAIMGQGEGLQGQSYAFPTLYKNMNQCNIPDLLKSVIKLHKCAVENKDKVFLVTKVGCGIAGHEEKFVKAIFNKFELAKNIILPKGRKL